MFTPFPFLPFYPPGMWTQEQAGEYWEEFRRVGVEQPIVTQKQRDDADIETEKLEVLVKSGVIDPVFAGLHKDEGLALQVHHVMRFPVEFGFDTVPRTKESLRRWIDQASSKLTQRFITDQQPRPTRFFAYTAIAYDLTFQVFNVNFYVAVAP